MRYNPRITPSSIDPTIREGFRSLADIVLRWDVRLAVGTILWCAVMAAVLTGCETPTAPTEQFERGPCAYAADFCSSKSINALDPEATHRWQEDANLYADAHYGYSTHICPKVEWHACYFVTPRGTCAAGYTESRTVIHVSTAEPQRTAALVAHETLHTRYWHQFGDPDEKHKRSYGW